MNDRGIIFGLFFFPAVGVWAAVMAYRMRRRKEQGASWPTASGIVTQAKFITGGKNADSAIVTYVYHKPEERRGSGLGPCGRFASDPAATVRRYPEGSHVRVRYDPERPDVSFLDSGDGGQIRLFIVLAIIGIAFPLAYYLWTKCLE
jgi:hypothetical protein